MKVRAAWVVLMVALPCGAVTLVKDGKPLATIVVREAALSAKPFVPSRGATGSADSKVLLAARELQSTLEKISGAQLALVGDAKPLSGPVILVGASRFTARVRGLAVPSGVTPERKEEAFLIETQGDTLVLAGNDDGPYEGTFSAVSELLHRLGVRWVLPGDDGTVLPSLKTVVIPQVHVLERPSFRLRAWWCNQTDEMNRAESLWKLRHKMQISEREIVALPSDGSLKGYLPDPKTSPVELFAKNPDGTVNTSLPNLSNPDAAKAVADKLIAALEDAKSKGAPLDSIGFAPDDGIPFDATPKSLEKSLNVADWAGRDGVLEESSMSEAWFSFVNQVAELVAKAFPHVIVATNGYSNRAQPPEGLTLAPNLSIMTAQIWADTLKPLNHPLSWQSTVQAAELERWNRMNSRVFLYEYNATMLVTQLTPVPQTRKLSQMYPQLQRMGLMGFVNETTQPWMQDGLATRNLRADLMWNSGLDAKAYLEDFYGSWYGPAAKPAHAFWDALETALLSTKLLGHEDRILPFVYSPELLAELNARCAEAEALATSDTVKKHVTIDRLILRHLEEYVAVARADADGRFADAAEHTAALIALRAELNALNPFLVMPSARTYPAAYYAGEPYWGAAPRLDWYRGLAARLDGSLGELVAMAPNQAKLLMDPAGVGKSLGWYARDRSDWATVDTTRPFYLQVPGGLTSDGIPWTGHLMYGFELDVPARFKGRAIRLAASSVACEAWVWVNGHFAGHRRYLPAYARPNGIDLDVTEFITPGRKNDIAVWVDTGTNRMQAAEGFLSRLFLHSPMPPTDAGH